MGIGRDSGLSTLCHSCAFACQQRLPKMFLSHRYWLSRLLLNLHICVAYYFVYRHAKKYTRTHTHTHTHKYIYTYIYICMYIYTYTYIYTYLYIFHMYKYIQQAFMHYTLLCKWEIVHVKEQRWTLLIFTNNTTIRRQKLY